MRRNYNVKYVSVCVYSCIPFYLQNLDEQGKKSTSLALRHAKQINVLRQLVGTVTENWGAVIPYNNCTSSSTTRGFTAKSGTPQLLNNHEQTLFA
jgi:hypothetical protein